MCMSPDGGIGRRARLKILLSKGSAGSIPVLGTRNPHILLFPAMYEGFLISAAAEKFLTLLV